jgi:signal transduction histidine kinase
MLESYSAGEGSGAAEVDAADAAARALAVELIARLLPGADAELVVSGLLAERAMRPDEGPSSDRPVSGGEVEGQADPAARELRRVRRQIALGDVARGLQHALNNPLTALFAEAQLLELEPLSDEHRRAVERIGALARRVADVARRLDISSSPSVG